MATQTTSFQGTKFYLGVGLNEEKAVTAVTVKPNATITATGHGAKAGDFVKLTGLGSLDGYYPVKSVTNEKITLADEVDWSNQDAPTSFTTAKVATVKWSSNFVPLNKLKAMVTLSARRILQQCAPRVQRPKQERLNMVQSNLLFSTPLQRQCNKICVKNSMPKKLSLG